jgi:ABC-type transport system involved in cytochrome bd biosynthesis fused ATPase/permease subunit
MVTVVLDLLQATLGYGLTIVLFFRYLGAAQDPSQGLLLGYWSIQLLILGQQVDIAARQVPLLRNTARRLIEPLAAVEDRNPEALHSERGASSSSGAALRLKGVRVVAAGHVLLDEVELAAEPGSHVAIVGPSGAGKSTLVGLLLGWHVPAAGELLVDGEPLTPERVESLRSETAWIDPAVQLWNSSLLDNLRYGSLGVDPWVGRAVEEGELRRLLEDLPQGLQSPLGEGGALVSGGEGQRVRFARSLLRPDARLVILDEPFRGLDREARGRLLDRACSWWRKATLLCITHDVGQTRTFDQVVVVKEGRVVESGCPRELEGRSGSVYRELLDREAALQRRFRESTVWRRLRLVEGGLIEEREEQGRG